MAARPRERRNLPLAAGPTLSRVRDRPRGAGPPGRRRCPLRVEAAADELRDRIARPPTAAPPVAPGHRRLGARILLSLGGVGTSRSRAQRRQSQRAALDVALRARGEARRCRHSGLALSRVTLRRHPDPSRARHRRLGSGALRPCRGASPARSRPPSGRDVPGHASGLQGRGRSGRRRRTPGRRHAPGPRWCGSRERVSATLGGDAAREGDGRDPVRRRAALSHRRRRRGRAPARNQRYRGPGAGEDLRRDGPRPSHRGHVRVDDSGDPRGRRRCRPRRQRRRARRGHRASAQGPRRGRDAGAAGARALRRALQLRRRPPRAVPADR